MQTTGAARSGRGHKPGGGHGSAKQAGLFLRALDADYVAQEIKMYAGDARSLDLIGSETIDLITTRPQAGKDAILMGDSRCNKHFIPITPWVLIRFLEVGFILRKDIIKLQWKMKSTRYKHYHKS